MVGQELEDPPASFKFAVWEHFGFPVEYNSDGAQVVDRAKTVCRRCFTSVRYVAGNTSDMLTHVRRHHTDMPVTGVRKKKNPVANNLSPI